MLSRIIIDQLIICQYPIRYLIRSIKDKFTEMLSKIQSKIRCKIKMGRIFLQNLLEI